MLKTFETVKHAHDTMYAKCGLTLENFAPEDESSAYYAHTFTIKDKHILFRIAKITLTKPGSFATIYKRGADNIINPYEVSDPIDFVVIAVVDGNNIGEFVFSKTVLCERNIFSTDSKEVNELCEFMRHGIRPQVPGLQKQGSGKMPILLGFILCVWNPLLN